MPSASFACGASVTVQIVHYVTKSVTLRPQETDAGKDRLFSGSWLKVLAVRCQLETVWDAADPLAD
jgi:hypothetical protein